MNYLGNELVFLENDRVNYWPDRRDRAVRRPVSPDKKVCRPDRFVSQYNNDFYNGWKHH
ncbi:MAG: MbtH domain-containing protein [Clostridium sp.]